MNIERSFVSVVLPFYNAEKGLDRAIQSIARQSLTDFECVLVNNNSADRSIEIAQKWAQKDSRFILIHEKRQGVMHASNSGSDICRGKYIARMDADDVSHPDRLRLQRDFLDKNPDFGAVSGHVNYISHKDSTEGFVRFVEWMNSIKTYEEIMNNRFVELPLANPSAMWRKETGLKYGLYRDGEFPEDYEMWLRWLESGVKIAKLEEMVLDWYDSDERLTRTDSIYSDASFYAVKTYYLARWLKKQNPENIRIAVWGASRISRRRAKLLEEYGIEVEFYIDTKRNRQLAKPVVYYSEIPDPGKYLILVYIKQADARAEIKQYLISRGYKEGTGFLMIS